MFKKPFLVSRINSSIHFEYAIYAGLFFFAFFFVFINNGMYWDTWTVSNQPFDTVAKSSMAGGNPFSGYSVYTLINWLPPFWARALVCALYFLSGVFLNKILKEAFSFKSIDRIIIVTLFMILPVNFARVCLIVFPYAVGYFTFFLGVYVFLFCIDEHSWKKVAYRFSSLALFYFSFIMLNSLLIFYAAFLILPLFSMRLRDAMLQGKFKNIWKYSDFLALPIIFYGVKVLFFTPYSSYQGYNEVTIAGVVVALKSVPLQVWNMTSDMLYFEFGSFEFVFLTLFSVLVFKVMMSVSSSEETAEGSRGSISGHIICVIVLSLVCMCLAVFPYAAVGKPIIFADWWSRNQILMPLGLSLLFYGLIRIIALASNKKIAYLCFSILVSFCIVKSGAVYYAYLLDNIKQQSLVEEFKSSSVIKNGTSFLVRDQAYELNTFDRIYRFYEYSGLMRKAFGDQRRFAVSVSHYNDDMAPFKGAELDSRMNIKGHPLNAPDILITISWHQNYDKVLSQLFWSYVFRDSDTFDKLKLDLLNVDTESL